MLFRCSKGGLPGARRMGSRRRPGNQLFRPPNAGGFSYNIDATVLRRPAKTGYAVPLTYTSYCGSVRTFKILVFTFAPYEHRCVDLHKICAVDASKLRGAIFLANFARRKSFRKAAQTHDPAPREAVPPGVICPENLRPCAFDRTDS